MTFQPGAAAGQELTLTIGEAGTIQYRDGLQFNRYCFTPSGQLVSLANTSKIYVKASNNMAGFQQLVLDERNGKFGDAGVQVILLTGTGGDYLTLLEGGGADLMRLTGNAAGGPMISTNASGEYDVSMTQAGRVFVNAGGGADEINANGALYPVDLRGGPQRDWLIGGARVDALYGEDGDDYIYSRDDLVSDWTDGGAGTDSGHFDWIDDRRNIENQAF